VEYPHAFNPTADADDIATALIILKEFPPESVKKELWLDIAERRWKNDPEKLEAIKAALDSDLAAAAAIKSMQENEARVMTMMNQGDAL